MKLWIVRFYKSARIMVFAKNIYHAKIEARKLRPDCTNKQIVEVRRIGK